MQLFLLPACPATILSIDTASARGWGDGWNQNQQGQNFQGQNFQGRNDQRQNWNGPRGHGHGFNMGARRPGGPAMGGMMMLQQFDTNKDGALSREELTAGLEKKITDNDKDGDNAITLEEFKTEWMKMTQDKMVRAYQRLDRDGSGKVTLEEVKQPALFMFDRRDFNNDGKIDQNDRPQRAQRMGGRFFQQNGAPVPAPAPAPADNAPSN